MVTRGGITVGLICEKVQDIYTPQSFTTILSLETPFQRLEALVSIPKLLIFFSGGVGTLVEYSTAMWSMDRGWIEPKRMILLGDHWRRTTEQICNSPFGLRHNSERPLQILEIDKPATLSAELTPILHEIASND
jgi:predicted Rossmann-fold nucleotide-binding protein